jgi:2,4-dienoyl-CoA reductase-like NADH-dependent reductase (Old Yellow Enzyme family)
LGIEALFQTSRIRNLTLKNRFVLLAMSRYNSPGGVPNDDLVAFHSKRASAGVAFQITGATAIDRPGANNHPDLANFRHDTYQAWHRVVDETHAAGGRLALQLWHAGGLFNVASEWNPRGIESPSGLERPGHPRGVPMTENAIAETIEAFAEAAEKAIEIGFDAVEIHAAHGFLLDQFFWPATNLRSDSWGGEAIERRARFGLEVTRAVRRRIGEQVPLFLKISQWKEQDYNAKLASDPREMERWLLPFVDAGVDVFDCSQRRFWESEFEGSDLNFAGWVKKVTGRPTVTLGSVGLNTEVMEFFNEDRAAEPAPLDELLRRFERGDFDFVGVGRALLGDPEWLTKIERGRFDELRAVYPADAFRVETLTSNQEQQNK